VAAERKKEPKTFSSPGLVRPSANCHLDGTHLTSDLRSSRCGPALLMSLKQAMATATARSFGTAQSFFK
jgi:hypothetical protein